MKDSRSGRGKILTSSLSPLPGNYNFRVLSGKRAQAERKWFDRVEKQDFHLIMKSSIHCRPFIFELDFSPF